MKKAFLILAVIAFVMLFQFCSSSKKMSAASKEPMKEVARITYVGNVQPLLVANCTPCHFPPKGNKKALDTYADAKATIDDIIARIQKNPGDRGFMPIRHPRLADSTINVFVQWKQDGLPEQ